MGYSRKAIKGLGWAGFLQIVSKVISFVKFIIIARFLSPAEFGLFGVAIIVVGFLEAITETGISSYIIQAGEREEDYISSAWVISIARGIILTFLTLLSAYPASIFFNSRPVLNIVIVASLIPFIRGFINPSEVKFQKDLNFDKEFIFRFSITIFDFIISTILIVIYRNPLVLIFALISSSFFEVILSFIFLVPKPKFVFNKEKYKKLFHFGKWLTLISSVNYFIEQFDGLIVGKILGLESLGVYELAQKFSLQIMIDGGKVFSKVTFPLFSLIKTDSIRTKRALVRILLLTIVLFGSLTLIIILFSKEFLLIFLGSKWLAANIPLKIFSLSGLVTVFMAVITSLFLAHAKQSITAKMILLRLIVLALIIVPASLRFGIIGTSSAALISYLVVLPIPLLSLSRILDRHK